MGGGGGLLIVCALDGDPKEQSRLIGRELYVRNAGGVCASGGHGLARVVAGGLVNRGGFLFGHCGAGRSIF